jgi:hypothetical protein
MPRESLVIQKKVREMLAVQMNERVDIERMKVLMTREKPSIVIFTSIVIMIAGE